MKHMKKWVGALVVTAALLGACQAEESEDKKQATEEVAEEVAEEPAAESKVAIPSKEALIQLVDQHFTGMMKGLSDAAYDYNIEGGDVTDAIYEAMKERFNNFATQSYIDGDLKVIAKDYCYLGCDALFFPLKLEGALSVEVEEVSADELKLTGKHPADIMISDVAFLDIIYLKHDDGLWKVNKVDYKEIELALTQEQASQIAVDWGYTNPQFVKERDDSFVFNANDTTLSVNKSTGFVEEGVAVTNTSPATSTTGSLFDVYDAKLDEVSAEAQRIVDSFTGYTTPEINENSAQVLEVWDTLLNEMYGVLKEKLPANEFAQLQQDQREWIIERDEYAEFTATEEAEGGTLYTSVYTHAQADYTAQRCADFLFDYMVGL